MRTQKREIDFLFDYECDNFTVSEGTNFWDINDIEYKTIIIKNGEISQEWITENLRTTCYTDGTPIPSISNQQQWKSLKNEAKCFDYKDEEENSKTYGKLYNWYAINNGLFCPEGWRIPSFNDWIILTAMIGSIGGSLKEEGTTHWLSPNTGATNQTQFNALPGGARMTDGEYKNIHEIGAWWSSTIFSKQQALYFRLTYNLPCANIFNAGMNNAFSVRLIRK